MGRGPGQAGRTELSKEEEARHDAPILALSDARLDVDQLEGVDELHMGDRYWLPCAFASATAPQREESGTSVLMDRHT